jgi:hypothetical protein
VYGTGKKVVERLLNYYVKEKTESSTQTMSLKELTRSLEKRIEFLDGQSEHLQDELR